MGNKVTRRDALKMSGLTAGGLILGGASSKSCDVDVPLPSERNTYFAKLQPYYPGTEELGENEMRISFLGSTTCLPRLAQACNSVFVELGNGDAASCSTAARA